LDKSIYLDPNSSRFIKIQSYVQAWDRPHRNETQKAKARKKTLQALALTGAEAGI
jgi:hypothetical protein